MDEQDLKIYNKGVKEGLEHATPSAKTMQEITKIKEHCGLRGTELALMNQTQKDQGKKLDKIIGKLDKLEKTFAGKWVERWVIGVTIIFALAALWIIFEQANLPH